MPAATIICRCCGCRDNGGGDDGDSMIAAEEETTNLKCQRHGDRQFKTLDASTGVPAGSLPKVAKRPTIAPSSCWQTTSSARRTRGSIMEDIRLTRKHYLMKLFLMCAVEVAEVTVRVLYRQTAATNWDQNRGHLRWVYSHRALQYIYIERDIDRERERDIYIYV